MRPPCRLEGVYYSGILYSRGVSKEECWSWGDGTVGNYFGGQHVKLRKRQNTRVKKLVEFKLKFEV
jgi:hypothetical protein